MPEIDAPSKTSSKRECLGMGLILLVFLSISLFVAARTPTVHTDEPVFADPAANLYYGSGFTSTMWGEDRHELWCSQPPLYTGLLYVFFKAFGFGLYQARAANDLFAAAGGILIWAGLRRSRFIQSPGYRLLALALVLSGSCSALTFRMIRYDVVMFLVSALVFFAWCQPAHCRARYLWVVLAGILCPWTGVPVLPYVALVLLIQLAVFRSQNIGLTVCVGAGFAIGTGLLLLYYQHFGVLDHFLKFVHGATHNDNSLMPLPKPSLKTIIFGQRLGEESLLTSFFGNPFVIENMKTMCDYSAVLLFLLFVPLGLEAWLGLSGRNCKFIPFVALTTLVIPPVIQLAGHYWSDYRWMTYIPLAIAVPRLLELAEGWTVSTVVRRAVFAILGLSLFLGVPFRSLWALPDWSARSVRPLKSVAAQVVKSNDVVICNFKAYFAVRPHAQLVYCSGLSAMGELRFAKDLPTNEVSLLCLFPTNLPAVVPVVGGKWKQVSMDNIPEAAALAQTRYGVSFYRRDTNSTP